MRLSAILLALGLLPAPAFAESIVVQCAESRPDSSRTVVCGTPGTVTFRSDGPEVEYFARVTAPATHCSPVHYNLFHPGTPGSVAGTGKLQPGQFENVSIGRGYAAGVNQLDIQATGWIEGCNVGAIHSWGVDVVVEPVP